MNTLLIKPEPAIGPTASPAAPLRLLKFEEPRTRILYVDDDASLRSLGKLVLARSGYDVDTAADGLEAWGALHDANYHLLITDQNMPRRTGLELATQVRLSGMRLPIVLVSGSMEALRDPSADWLALAARLPKPFRPDALIGTVEQVLLATGHLCERGDARVSAAPRPGRIQSCLHWGINE